MLRWFLSALLLGLLIWAGWPGLALALADPPTEYFGLELGLLTESIGRLERRVVDGSSEVTASAGIPGQLGFRIWTLHWLLGGLDHGDVAFSWTPAELVGGFLYVYPMGTRFSGEYDRNRGFEFYAGTAPGLTLRLGDRRQFQLGLGLGIGAGWLLQYVPTWDEPENEQAYGLMFSPSIRLRYQTEGSFSHGLGLRALVAAQEGPHGEQFGVLQLFYEFGYSAPPQPVAQAEVGPWTWHDTWGHAAFWTGLALAGFGGLATWEAYDAGRQDDREASSAWAGGMYAGFITGGLLMITGAVLWAIAPDSVGALAGAEGE